MKIKTRFKKFTQWLGPRVRGASGPFGITLAFVFLLAALFIIFLLFYFFWLYGLLKFVPGFWKQSHVTGKQFMNVATNLFTALITLLSVLVSAGMLWYTNMYNARNNRHAESGWRTSLFSTVDNPKWTLKDLLILKNRLNPEILNKPKKDTFEYVLAMEVEGLINEYQSAASVAIPYSKTLKTRQLVRMWLKNDWLVMGDKPERYTTASQAESVMISSELQNK